MTCPPCTNDCNEGRTCPAQNKILEEDDDVQDYKKPWVGLTRMELIKCGVLPYGMSYELYQTIEKKLKEKNQ